MLTEGLYRDMRVKSRFLLVFSGFLGILLALSLFSAPLSAKSLVKTTSKTTDQYDIYSGGIHFITASLTSEKTVNSYSSAFTASAQGFLGKLLPWTAEITVDGALHDGKLTPRKFVNQTAWKKVPKTATLHYDKNGKLVKFIEDTPKRGIVEKDIDPKLALNTVDVLTAVLQIVSKPLDKTCDSSYPVYDGKRRFNIVLKEPKNIILEKTKYNSFSGDAIECVLDIEPIAGFKEKKSGWSSIDADENKKAEQPTVWFGVDKTTGAVKLAKARIKTDFGMVLVHLANK